MKTVTVDLGERSYPIYVEDGCLTNIGEYLAKHYSGKRAALITDSIVKNYYAAPVEKSLEDSGFEVTLVEMPPGEKFKTLSVLESVFDRLIEKSFSRDTVIISLGGGVVGDLAGFAAAALLRGVKFVQIPTTIIAQTDSSVGGKVAVNHRLGKNLIGAFYQPLFVFIDPGVLKTLPPREVNAGMSEVIKYGAIKDEAFFTFIEENCENLKSLQDMEKIEKALIRSCEIKAEVVNIDEKESGLRRILNFGHTIGHAIENITDYKVYLHGEAIALGMIAAGWISTELGMIDKDKFNRLEQVVRKIDIPKPVLNGTVRNKNISDSLLEAIARDKKVKKGKVNFVLLNDIGETAIRDDVPDELIKDAFNYLTENIK
ncbi:3-dehydroquinate synthase [candidate division KSB1 bacterium]